MAKKKETFVKQMFNIGVGTLITILIGIITTPLITRLVNPIDYGRFAIFNTYSTLGLSFFCLGVDQAFVRFYFEETNVGRQAKLLEKCIKLPLCIFIFMIAMVVCIKINGFLKSVDYFVLVMFIMMVGILLINRFALLNLRVKYESKWYALIKSLTKVLYVIFVILLFLFKYENNLHILIIAHILSVLFPTLIAIIVKRESWRFGKVQNEKTTATTKELLRYGLPLMFSTSIFSLFQASDRIVLDYLCEKTVVGVYASAQSLITIFSVIQQSFNIVWGARAIEKYEIGEGDSNYYKKTNRIVTIIMFSFGATVLVFKDIFVLFLGEKYREAATIIPFLMLNPIMYTISETTNIGTVVKKKSIYQVYTMIISCVCNLAGNFILIPICGAKGAAISTGISYIIFFVLRTFFSKKFMDIDYSLKKFFIITACFVMMAFWHCMYQNRIIDIILYFVFMVLLISQYKEDFSYILIFMKNKIYEKIHRRKRFN